MKKLLILLAAVVAGFTLLCVYLSVTLEESPVATPAPEQTVTVPPTPPASIEMLQLINQQRAKAGVGKLTQSSALDQTAANKVKDMVAGDYYDHTNPKTGKRGVSLIFDRMGATCNWAAENLAASETSSETVTEWTESPPHRLAMLDSKADIAGFGIQKTENGYYFVVLHLCDVT